MTSFAPNLPESGTLWPVFARNPRLSQGIRRRGPEREFVTCGFRVCRSLASLALASAAPHLPLAAQQPAPAAAPVSADGRAVVAEVRRIIAERYVLPERRPALDAILARGLAAGRYGVADPGQLAERINADLETAGHDRHLNFHYDPRPAAGLAARTAQGEPDQQRL